MLSDPVQPLAINVTKGMFWNLTENLGTQAVQFVISIILARLLIPEQYGLIGMLALFIGLAQSLVNSGFGSALVQKKEVTQLDYSSVFYLNLFIGLVLTALLYWAAPFIAEFYQEPILKPLTRLLSLNIIINALSLVATSQLLKSMNFKAFVKVSLFSISISGILGIILAVKGLGVWSLAIQSVVSTLIRTILLWQVSHWRPSLEFSMKPIRTMFPFGSRMLGYGLLETIFQNIYQPLFGKLYSATALGYYVRAQGMQNAFVLPISAPLASVLFPALVPLQDDTDKLKLTIQKTLIMVAFINFPLMIGLIALAEPIIVFLMTERWIPSSLYFQLMCVEGLLLPIHVLNLNTMKVKGRSDLLFRIELIKKLLILMALVITYRWGIAAVLIGQIIASTIAFAINSIFSGKLIRYSALHQIRDSSVFLLMAFVMGAGMHLVGRTISQVPIRLVVEGSVGLVIYLVLSLVIKKQVFSEALILAKNILRAARA